MGKHGSGGKATSKPLVLPAVSEKDLDNAKARLASAEQKKRILSQMRFNLTAEGTYDDYQAAPMKERKEFLLRWAARQLKDGSKKTKNWQGVEKLISSESAGYEGGWVSKAFLVKELGEIKANNTIAALRRLGKARADQLTGLDDDENADFKWSKDVFAASEVCIPLYKTKNKTL